MTDIDGASKYYVAIRYLPHVKHYGGSIYWTDFESKQALDKWLTPEMRELAEVVEEGISKERCIELFNSTPHVSQTSIVFKGLL
jgi:hypothetical protein